VAASDESGESQAPKAEPTPAERAFLDGDWAASQRLARADAASSDEKVAAAGRATLSRFKTDLLVPALYGVAILFAVIAILHWGHR
jgi:hypothetical protein